ncbi:hypothetical protein BBP40_008704 [Aspergillus hancockii]|nr:hypothetical protein BBP40_008704 [Aspergillus hancockii]
MVFTTNNQHRGAAEQWLLDRVLALDWQREEFLDVEHFLQRLLLLVYITEG